MSDSSEITKEVMGRIGKKRPGVMKTEGKPQSTILKWSIFDYRHVKKEVPEEQSVLGNELS